MATFTYEEQGEKKYLVYEKKPEDKLDNLTLEMISNNKIEGLVPANHIQMDDHFYMKYDITGCKSLREYMQGQVNRKHLLGMMETIADTALEAEDYMLKFSSYVLEADYMYMDKNTGKLMIVVLPIVRTEIPLEQFLKELLMGARYDQTEDCGYVAALISFFSSTSSFSLCGLKEQISRLKEKKQISRIVDEKKPEEKKVRMTERISGSMQPTDMKPQIADKYRVNPIGSRGSIDPEKQNCLDILFSEEEEISLKEKIENFFKKEKPEKKKEDKGKEKDKKKEKNKKREKSGSDFELAGIAIPGVEIPIYKQKDRYLEELEQESLSDKYEKWDFSIPDQKMKIKQMHVEEQDFGETAYISGEEEENDETQLLGQTHGGRIRFNLYRPSTRETFPIHGDVVRVGRSSSIVEICITGNKCVGRIHAILYVRGGQVFIEDNHSKNYTYVDGTRLNPEEPPIRLAHGCTIRLGDEELEFCVEE